MRTTSSQEMMEDIREQVSQHRAAQKMHPDLFPLPQTHATVNAPCFMRVRNACWANWETGVSCGVRIPISWTGSRAQRLSSLNGWTRIVQAAFGIAARNAGQDLLSKDSNGPYPPSKKRRDRRSIPGLICTLTLYTSEPMAAETLTRASSSLRRRRPAHDSSAQATAARG